VGESLIKQMYFGKVKTLDPGVRRDDEFEAISA
jgi:hypothetical protein